MRYTRGTLLAVLVGAVVALGSGSYAATTARAGGAPGTTITIPGDTYSPSVLVINAGETVTWINKDSDGHVTTSIPGDPEAFTLPTAPGKSAQFKFTKAGVYGYYCLTHASYDPNLRRVAAHKGSDFFPAAMEGVIIVKGPGLTGTPQASLTFANGDLAPNIAVIKAGGRVTWLNKDAKNRLLEIPAAGAEKLALPAGKSQTATFAKPGVYLFYDSNAATLDPKTGLVKSKSGTKVFPVSMQGYVIVL
ncbi:MAG: plastocyanin/azurin family copper-binding protein [bacterium]